MGLIMRFISYLAPGLPEDLFELIVRRLGADCTVDFDPRSSGPAPNEPDPFATGRYDGAFICTPPLLSLRSVELAGAAFVFDDPRADGRPLYFADVVARPDFQRFEDLRGATWAYNDDQSLSGYYAMLLALRRKHQDISFFEALTPTGSHLASLQAVAQGQADAASIDSQTLRLYPDLAKELRVIDTWGPFPTHPIVLRRELDADAKRRIKTGLLTMPINAYGVIRLAPIDNHVYQQLLTDLAALLPTPTP